VFVLTDAPPFDAFGIRTGSKASKARQRLRREREISRRVLAVTRRKDVLVAGLSSGRVAFLASATRRISDRRAARFVAKSR
jgi:CHASE1-domain containing sensor protein